MKLKAAGLTLIEIMIAIVILAVGVVIIVKFQGDLLRNLGSTQQQSEAVALAETRLNNLRNYVYLDSADGSPAYNEIVNGNEVVVNNNTTYTVSWVVTDVASPPYKQVVVTVTWSTSSNQTESITLESIIGQVDPVKTGEVMQGL